MTLAAKYGSRRHNTMKVPKGDQLLPDAGIDEPGTLHKREANARAGDRPPAYMARKDGGPVQAMGGSPNGAATAACDWPAGAEGGPGRPRDTGRPGPARRPAGERPAELKGTPWRARRRRAPGRDCGREGWRPGAPPAGTGCGGCRAPCRSCRAARGPGAPGQGPGARGPPPGKRGGRLKKVTVNVVPRSTRILSCRGLNPCLRLSGF